MVEPLKPSGRCVAIPKILRRYAIHLASAENAKVDIFLTTDDNLQKVANRNKNLLLFVVINPVKWLDEVLK